MKTYWFTVASGPKYHEIVKTLALSCRKHGIDLNIVEAPDENGRTAKHRKIEGILNAPEGFDRIVFLDADTMILDPEGIDAVSGSWQIPWRMPTEDSIPKRTGYCVLRSKADTVLPGPAAGSLLP